MNELEFYKHKREQFKKTCQDKSAIIANSSNSYEEYESQMTSIWDKIDELEMMISQLEIPHFKNIDPNCGTLYTLEDFISMVEDGSLIDYDGSGVYSDGELKTQITIIPSWVKQRKHRTDFSHVLWFNR